MTKTSATAADDGNDPQPITLVLSPGTLTTLPGAPAIAAASGSCTGQGTPKAGGFG